MTPEQIHVAICDDEPDLREMLGEYLARRGFAVTLAEVKALAGDRRVFVARELTKAHEEIVRGSAVELAARYAQAPPRGEVVLVLGPRSASGADQDEPIGPDHPLVAHGDRTVLTPHMAGYTDRALAVTSDIVAASVVAALEGTRPPHTLNEPDPWRGRAAVLAASEPGAVVGSEDHQRARIEIKVTQRLQNLADAPIDFHYGVAIRPALRLAVECG